jgi:PAS domain-containing protein
MKVALVAGSDSSGQRIARWLEQRGHQAVLTDSSRTHPPNPSPNAAPLVVIDFAAVGLDTVREWCDPGPDEPGRIVSVFVVNAPAGAESEALLDAGVDDLLFAPLRKAQFTIRLRLFEQRLARQAETNARFDLALSNLPGVLYQRALRPDGSLAFDYISPTSEELWGFTPEQIRAQPEVLLEALLPEDRAGIVQARAESRDALTPFAYEYRIRPPRDGPKWVRSIPIYGAWRTAA